MEPVTTTRRWILRTSLALGLAAIVSMFALFHVDYGDYNAFRRAIKSEGFEIQKKWIYEEDFVLEDFGVYIKKTGLGFWLDIRNLSNVRRPDAKIEGILLESMHEGWENNQRVIAFASSFWREEKLPMVNTPREFLAHAHVILPAIYRLKTKFPKNHDEFGAVYRTYKNFLIIRDDPSHLAPVTESLIEDAN